MVAVAASCRIASYIVHVGGDKQPGIKDSKVMILTDKGIQI